MKCFHAVRLPVLVLAAAISTDVSLAQSGGYAVTERGADYAVHQAVTVTDGTNRLHSYTELAAGLNYTNASGQWLASKEEIDVLPNGTAVATNGQHQAYFPGNIYQGVVELVTPDGRQLKSRPLGLSYYDGTNNVLIAELKSSQGYVVGSNVVIYPDAFTDFKADLRYTYTKAGFEQDVILREQPPAPKAYRLDARNTVLEVATEFFDTADPAQTNTVARQAGLQDTTLTFGQMKMIRGKAFAFDGATNTANAVNNGTPTYKSWQRIAGRTFLFEDVPVAKLTAQLQQLPASTSAATTVSSTDPAWHKLSAARLLPPLRPAQADTGRVQLATTGLDTKSGVVLDYVTVSGMPGDYTFASGTTYYVSGVFDVVNATFEGGTVIKYPIAGSATAYIVVEGTLTCATSGVNPAIFTAADDDTVGQVISGSTGNPSGNYYADPALLLVSQPSHGLTNACIRYAAQAVVLEGDGYGTSLSLADVQVVDSGVMAVLGSGNGWDGPMTLTCNNCLCKGGYYGTMVLDNGNASDSYNFNNCTVVNVYNLVDPLSFNSCSGNAVNSIFANVSNLGYYVSWDGSDNLFYYSSYATFGSSQYTTGASPFESFGTDNYYLATGSSWRNVGTTSIASDLQADLATRTTYAPPDGYYPDNDGQPDLGYHYPVVNTDADSDGLPDWWEQYWFGSLGQAGTNLDSSGFNTLLADYQAFTNGTPVDPNVIQFSIAAANDHVNVTTVPVPLAITAGNPYYYAVLVSGSTTTNWTAFTTTNLAVYLGTTDGVYDVQIGLKGLPASATQTWQDYTFTLDRVAPVLTITNPVIMAASNNATVIKPYLQLQGYASEQLSSLSYDISNATGITTNQDAFVTDQYCDTNVMDFTTNWFQAYDVPLTNGLNRLTLRVADRAGNTTTTNFNVTLDYTTATNPVIQLTWPTNGMALCGGSFTLRGWTDDETAPGISASITSTNIITGGVERSGVVWVENLPLDSGTNWITLDVTNSAGLASATNFWVVQSSMTLSVDWISGDLWVPPVNVGGSISDHTAAVWVNGVQGTNIDGNWEVDNVGVSPSGMASFDVSAVPAGGGDPDFSTNVEKHAEIVMTGYDETKVENEMYEGAILEGETKTKTYTNQPYADTNGWWHDDDESLVTIHHIGNPDSDQSYDALFFWTPTFSIEIYADGGYTNIYSPMIYPYPDWYGDVGSIPDIDQTEVDGWPGNYMTHYYAAVYYHTNYDDGRSYDIALNARTSQKLMTGGKDGVGRQNLFCINVTTAQAYGPPPGDGPGLWWDTPATNIPYAQMRALGKQVGADGKVWVALPDNASPDLGLVATASDHYNAVASEGKYKLRISARGNGNNYDDLSVTNPEFCVGQNLTFVANWDTDPSAADTIYHWHLPEKYMNEAYVPYPNTTSSCISYRRNDNLLTNADVNPVWYVNGTGGACSLFEILHFSNGQYASVAAAGSFKIYRPTFSDFNRAPYFSCEMVCNTNTAYGISNGIPICQLFGSMNWQIKVNSQYDGHIAVTQLIKASGVYWKQTFGNYYLDGNTEIYGLDLDNYSTADGKPYFVNDTTIGAHSIGLVDNPFTLWLPYVEMYGDFQDYLRFKPSGDSIWVTLAIINWHANGYANAITGTVITSLFPADNPPTDTDSFPEWLNNVSE